MYYSGAKWEFFAGYNLQTWALPLQVSVGFENYGRQWGFGMRVLCFTFGATKDFQGYALIRGKQLPAE